VLIAINCEKAKEHRELTGNTLHKHCIKIMFWKTVY